MLEKRETRHLLDRWPVRVFPEVRDRPAGEIEGEATQTDYRLYYIRIVIVLGVPNGSSRSRHVRMGEQARDGINDVRIHQGFVALDVDVTISG